MLHTNFGQIIVTAAFFFKKQMSLGKLGYSSAVLLNQSKPLSQPFSLKLDFFSFVVTESTMWSNLAKHLKHKKGFLLVGEKKKHNASRIDGSDKRTCGRCAYVQL